MKISEEQKKINRASWFFMALVVVYILVVILLRVTGVGNSITMVQNVILSQSMIFVPTIVHIILTRCSIRETLRLRLTHWAMILLVPVFVIALEPLMTLINALSLMWVESGTEQISTDLLANHPLWVSLLLAAVTPAVVEELAYRGVVLGTFRHSNRLWAIITSGFLFGVMHMNFNQMAYAIVLGIMFGLLAEATGSIFSTMYAHFCFNGISVLLGYVAWHVGPLRDAMEQSLEQGSSTADLRQTVSMLVSPAVIGLLIAIAILYSLSVLNGRKEEFTGLFRKQARTTRIISAPLVITVCVCIGLMVFFEVAY